MKVVLNFIQNINLCYVVLNILSFIVLCLYLKEASILDKGKKIIFGVFLLASLIGFSYFNGVIQSIFQLKYLSVKCYLLMMIVVNIIVLFTMNREVKFVYSVVNYTFYILMMIIFGSIVAVILGNKFPNMYVMDISNAVVLIDLSFVIFILYLIMVCLIYIGYFMFSNHSINEAKEKIQKEKIKVPQFKKSIFSRKKQKEEKQVLTDEELLSYYDKSNFFIHGVDCSIIFEDSNTDNIIKNYHILLDNIEAKLMNGYTLEENKLLKSICLKLRVNNLTQVDIQSNGILNRVSIEEYNFLKKIMNVH